MTSDTELRKAAEAAALIAALRAAAEAQPNVTVASEALTALLDELDTERAAREKAEAWFSAYPKRPDDLAALIASAEAGNGADAKTVLEMVRTIDAFDLYGDTQHQRAEAAEAALSASQEEVKRLTTAMDREEAYLLRMIEAEDDTGGLMMSDVQGAFHRIRDKDSDDMERADEAAAKETPHAE